jgi:hypothetical protein
MLSRRHSLQIRLLNAYKVLMGALLLLVWLTGIGYFFLWERAEIKQSTHAAATMLATQSSAALMFGDTQVLRENLASLKNLEGIRWAAIVATNTNVPVPLIGDGNVPDDIQRLIDRMESAREHLSLNELVVQRASGARADHASRCRAGAATCRPGPACGDRGIYQGHGGDTVALGDGVSAWPFAVQPHHPVHR